MLNAKFGDEPETRGDESASNGKDLLSATNPLTSYVSLSNARPLISINNASLLWKIAMKLMEMLRIMIRNIGGNLFTTTWHHQRHYLYNGQKHSRQNR